MIRGERTLSNTDSLVAQRAGMFSHRVDFFRASIQYYFRFGTLPFCRKQPISLIDPASVRGARLHRPPRRPFAFAAEEAG
jgi:hypothetical protein